jgi:hypothetical protein
LLVLLTGMACGSAPGAAPGGGRVRVQVAPGADTVRFEAAASAERCGGGRGVLLRGVDRGNGLLVWIRTADTLAAGSYRLVAKGDTMTPQVAIAAVRYMKGDVVRGFSLDDGSITMTRSGGRLGGQLRGGGVEFSGARRAALVATFADLQIERDTVPCKPHP